jgi:fructose-1,6-bisphosphatase/inositol monophosphatase family enzyme
VAQPGALRHLNVLLPQQKWWNIEQRSQFNGLFAAGISPAFFDCAGLHYVELASGRHTAMIMPWEYPWDHAAGLLLHAEAGGTVIGMGCSTLAVVSVEAFGGAASAAQVPSGGANVSA